MNLDKLKSMMPKLKDDAGGKAGAAGGKAGGGQGAAGKAGDKAGAGGAGKAGGKAGPGKVAPVSPSKARLERRANDEKIIKNIKIAFTTIVVIAVVGVAISIFLYAYKPAVATVAGAGISQYEFIYSLKTSSMGASEYSTPESVGQQALSNAADTKMREVIAKEKGLKVTQEDRDMIKSQLDYIDQIGGSSPGTGINAKLGGDNYLRNNFGISRSQYTKLLNSELLASHLMDQEYENINVPEEDARAAYDEKISTYREATVRHILFLYEGPKDENGEGTRTREESEQMAQKTVDRINSGEDMAELVQELSEDTDLSNEGIYTFKPSDGYEQGFKDWAFDSARQVDDVGICETSYGYHVMRLEGMRTIPFEEVSEEITDEIKDRQVDQLLESWKSEERFKPQVNQRVFDSLVAQEIG